MISESKWYRGHTKSKETVKDLVHVLVSKNATNKGTLDFLSWWVSRKYEIPQFKFHKKRM